MRKPKLATNVLRACGLSIMRDAGRPLTRAQNTRAELYQDASGEMIALRTNNARCLQGEADRTSGTAVFGFQKAPNLLIAMPTTPRGMAEVEAFLVPSEEAADELRRVHNAWLAGGAATKGENRMWALWFDDRDGVVAASGGFAEKWRHYRIGSISVPTSSP